MTERRRRGASVFDFYNISYNAGYTKYRGAKKPSFSGFRPFRRFLSLLGWLGRFFAFCTVVLFECIALYVWSAFCFTIVRLLVKPFLTLMSSSLPLDSGAAYLQQAFLYLCSRFCCLHDKETPRGFRAAHSFLLTVQRYVFYPEVLTSAHSPQHRRH